MQRDDALQRLRSLFSDLEERLGQRLSAGHRRYQLTPDDALLCSGALELAQDFLASRTLERLSRFEKARRTFESTRDPRAAIRALGWAKKQGQQYDAAQVVELYRALTTPGPALDLVDDDFLAVLDKAGGKPVVERPARPRINPPLSPSEALVIVTSHFRFNSRDAACEYLRTHGTRMKTPLRLPPRGRCRSRRKSGGPGGH